MNKRTQNRIVFVVIVLLFAIPLIAAFALRSSGWKPTNTKNTGTLVEPPRDITQVPATLADGKPFVWKDPQYRWTLLMLPNADCAAKCIERIDEAVRMRARATRSRGERMLRRLGVRVILRSATPPAPRMSMRFHDPLTASKPVA